MIVVVVIVEGEYYGFSFVVVFVINVDECLICCSFGLLYEVFGMDVDIYICFVEYDVGVVYGDFECIIVVWNMIVV